jgi:hypothetical protein
MSIHQRSLELTGLFGVPVLMLAVSCLNSIVIFTATGLLFSPNFDSDQYQRQRFVLLMQRLKKTIWVTQKPIKR